MTMGKVTLQDIAKIAGCSRATVSVALSGAIGSIAVSTAMKVKIREIARTLGYSGNYHARSLTTGRAAAIGLLAGSSFRGRRYSDWTGQMIEGIGACVQAQGFDLVMLGAVDDEDDLPRGTQYLQQQRIDALIVTGLMYRATAKGWPPANTPLVVAMALEQSPFPAVYLDQQSGLREAMTHLAHLGHRSVLWTTVQTAGKFPTPTRNAAFRAAVHTYGMHAQEYVFAYRRDEQPETLAGQIADYRNRFADYLTRQAPPSAVFADNEVAGFGIYQALAAIGLRVPEDVSLIGFDDLWGELAIPPMTVLSLNFREIGWQAAELALEIANGAPVTPALTRTVPTTLVVRQSTTWARSGR